ncbi:MAG: DNA-3-methyladenine glycosylase [Treponema sp.]
MEDFFSKSTIELAKALLGKLLLSKCGLVGGYIVETEAYLGVSDKACHSYGGKRTPKVEAMYQQAGTIYIYTLHHHKMLNIVSCPKGEPQAVLIRAIEPVYNISLMEENRKKTGILISNGPGKLTQAMGIDDSYNMTKMQDDRLFIDFQNSKTPKSICTSSRIGIPNKDEWTYKQLRFFVKGNKYVSLMKKRDFLEDVWNN